MDRTGTSASLWFLYTIFVCYLFNCVAHDSIGSITPLEHAHGQRPDVSALLRFRWYEPVYYLADGHFPSGGFEKSGQFVGIAEDMGDALMYYILTDDTHQVILWSIVHSSLDPQDPNHWALPRNSRAIHVCTVNY